MEYEWPNWDNKKDRPYLTGYFRDGETKIDLILVTTETSSIEVETAKLNFIVNIVDAGLKIELEPGVKPRNKNLWFIKINAPTHILSHYSYIFNCRKYFKGSHLNLMKSNVTDEIELIKLIRSYYAGCFCTQKSRIKDPEPLEFSSYERSILVYRILHAVSFGVPSNYRGIHKLLYNNVINAVYPLHEGPYFLTNQQTQERLNGRQALFYRWAGYKNLFRRQPIHLIREYMGERVAFLFAFYEYYMITIILPAIIGILFSVVGHIDSPYRKKTMGVKLMYDFPFYNPADLSKPKYTMRYERKAICPKCSDFVACPFKNLTAYKREFQIKNWLDNPYTMLYCLIVASWGVLFHTLWMRKEQYLNWIWEVNKGSKRFPTPEYTFPLDSTLKHNQEPRRPTMIQHLIELAKMSALLLSYILIVFPGLLNMQLKLWNRMRYIAIAARVIFNEKFTYFVTAFVANINGVLCVGLDKVYQFCSIWSTRMLIPRTYEQFEMDYMIKMFTLCFLSNFGFICYVAFFKGALYTYPNDPKRWYIPLQLGMLNCGILGCIDELFIVYFASYKAKRCFKAILDMIDKWNIKKDLPRNHKLQHQDVPCWEREFELTAIDSEFVMKKFNHIFMDIVEATFFLPCFPLSVLMSLFLNIWEIRSWATFMLLKCRRPLLIEDWGLGSWQHLLMILPHLMIFSSVLTFSRTTSYFDRALFNHTHGHLKYVSFYMHYYTGFFNTSEFLHFENESSIKIQTPMQQYYVDYNKNFYNMAYNDPGLGNMWESGTRFPEKGPAHFCLFPGQYNRLVDNETLTHIPNTYVPLPGHYYVLFQKASIIIVCQMIIVLFALLINNLIKVKSEKIKNIKNVEEAIKYFHIHKELLKRNKLEEELKKKIEEREAMQRGDDIPENLDTKHITVPLKTQDTSLLIQDINQDIIADPKDKYKEFPSKDKLIAPSKIPVSSKNKLAASKVKPKKITCKCKSKVPKTSHVSLKKEWSESKIVPVSPENNFITSKYAPVACKCEIAPKTSNVSFKEKLSEPKILPVSPENKLVTSKNTPVSFKEELSESKILPVSLENKLVTSKNTPVSFKEELSESKISPVYQENKLIISQDVPVSSQEKLTISKLSPLSSKEKLPRPKHSLISLIEKPCSPDCKRKRSKSPKDRKRANKDIIQVSAVHMQTYKEKLGAKDKVKDKKKISKDKIDVYKQKLGATKDEVGAIENKKKVAKDNLETEKAGTSKGKKETIKDRNKVSQSQIDTSKKKSPAAQDRVQSHKHKTKEAKEKMDVSSKRRANVSEGDVGADEDKEQKVKREKNKTSKKQDAEKSDLNSCKDNTKRTEETLVATQEKVVTSRDKKVKSAKKKPELP